MNDSDSVAEVWKMAVQSSVSWVWQRHAWTTNPGYDQVLQSDVLIDQIPSMCNTSRITFLVPSRMKQEG